VHRRLLDPVPYHVGSGGEADVFPGISSGSVRRRRPSGPLELLPHRQRSVTTRITSSEITHTHTHTHIHILVFARISLRFCVPRYPCSAGLQAGWSWVRVSEGAGNFFSPQPRTDRLWGPPSLLSGGSQGLSLDVRQPVHETDQSPASIAEVKNAWSYTSTPPVRLNCVMLSLKKHRDNFTFTVILVIYSFEDKCSAWNLIIIITEIIFRPYTVPNWI